jgi:glycyl-tRNA synthetase
MTLNTYWADHGALIWQPYHETVAAGTANPGTILRVLGPEPWHIAYVEPSFRPDDGRFGDNPNRMQMHFQYQVILKPDPGNPQELYLAASLPSALSGRSTTSALWKTTGKARRWGRGAWGGK